MMLTKLQRSPEEKQDALSWLLACHQRIRHFTALAQRLSARLDAPPAEVAEVAAGIHRYFHLALPLHEQDEELSLLPRLIGKDLALVQALSMMQQEHHQIDTVLAPMLLLLQGLSEDPGQHAARAAALALQANTLDALWQPHLAQEEQLIFAAAEKSLDDASKDRLMQEMKARRTTPP